MTFDVFCSSRGCDGYHKVHQADSDDEPAFLACVKCQKTAPADHQEDTLNLEKRIQQEIDCVDRVADLGIPRDVTANVRSIKPPHSHHGVALPICRAQFELCDQMGQFSKAIAAERRWIDCRFQLHGQDYLDEQTGFGYERLGDVLVKGRDWKGASEAYQRAVRALMIARGESSEPYSKCAMEKVVFVQKQWKSPMQKSGPFCALCGCVAVNKCGRCGLVVHCCRDHQTFHWKSVHRQTCAKLT